MIQWLKYGENETKLCSKYPVIFRIGERLHDQSCWGCWKERWKEICSNSANIQQSIRNQLLVEDNNCDYIYDEQENIYLGLKPILSNKYQDILEEMTYSGTPIFLWLKNSFQECENKQGLQVIQRIINNLNNLQSLPEIIMKERRRANRGDNSNHIGHHLCLIWDDPLRIPRRESSDENKVINDPYLSSI